MGTRRRIWIAVAVAAVGIIGVVAWPRGIDDASQEGDLVVLPHAEKPDFELISTGEEVDIEDHFRPGAKLLIEFTAEW